jgi:hypothetical protein
MVSLTIDELADSLGSAIAEITKELETDFAERHAALEARLARLEAMPRLRYCGIWKPETTYSAESLTTHSGSLWLARAETSQRPGNGVSGWVLIAKRGSK